MNQAANVVAVLCAALGVVHAGQLPPAAYVDTRIGSGGVGFGIGGINPGAQVPYGALRLGPDTSLGLGESRSFMRVMFEHICASHAHA
jgi:putative alpha-1,2-mannosidase